MYAPSPPFYFIPHQQGVLAVASRAFMGHPTIKAGELCAELSASRRTLYRHVDPMVARPPHGEKLFGRNARRSCLILNSAEAGT